MRVPINVTDHISYPSRTPILTYVIIRVSTEAKQWYKQFTAQNRSGVGEHTRRPAAEG